MNIIIFCKKDKDNKKVIKFKVKRIIKLFINYKEILSSQYKFSILKFQQ